MDASISMLEERVTFQRQPAKWQGIVEAIAKEFSCPLSKVEQILITETHQLEQGAHIKDFIPVLAIKQVKELLRMYRHIPTRHEQRDLNHPLPSHSRVRDNRLPVSEKNN